MTNTFFINALAENLGKSKRETREFMVAFEKTLKEFLVKDKFKVADLTFSLKDVAERTGRNIQTGEPLVIPAHKRLCVKPSKEIKEMLK